MRRALAALAWDPGLAPEVRACARRLLERRAVDEAGVGALLVTCVGAVEDLPVVTAAMTRFLDPTANSDAPAAAMSGSFDPFLMASQGLLYLGARPVAEPATTGEVVVYLDGLLVLPEWRPPGWRGRCQGWQNHPAPLVRYTARRALERDRGRQDPRGNDLPTAESASPGP